MNQTILTNNKSISNTTSINNNNNNNNLNSNENENNSNEKIEDYLKIT
jgi:hypothetical protein